MISAHFCGCFIHYIGINLIERGNTDSWLFVHNISHNSLIDRYINSIYFSVLIMITGGTINTNSNFEKMNLVFIIILTTGIFAYSINTIGNILNEIKKNDTEIKLIYS